MPLDIHDARSRLADAERVAPADIRPHLQALAHPRLPGSDGAAAVDEELRSRFQALGYEGRALDFSFSTLPGRFGLTAAGAALLVTAVAATVLLWLHVPAGALGVLVAGLALAAAPLLALGPALRRLPWGRLESANLLFRDPATRPSWILMAHRDSKSQVVPTLIRSGALMLGAVAWGSLVVMAVLDLVGVPVGWWVVLVGGAALAGTGVVLGLSWAANASPGALDNATGLAALLAVAERVGPGGDVAFLITDGEELGLAGARLVADALPPVQGVINVDSLDDRGTTRLAEGTAWRRRGTAPQLAAALLVAGRVLDVPVERRALPRTIQVDHQPLAAAGVPSLTVLRGDARSLLRVHRPADALDRLDGRGAAETATLLCAAIRLLRADADAHLAGGGGGGS